MKSLKLFLLLVFNMVVVFVFSQKEQPVTLDLGKAISQKPKTVMLSEIASDIRYIPLETKEECLIGNEFFISFFGNDIIASEHKTRSFFRFDRNGNFMNTIGKRGQGPGEYNVGLLYMTDPKNGHLYVQDFGDLLCYDKQGNFIKKIATPNLNMGAAEMLNDESIIYSNNLYFETKKDQTQLYVIDKNGKVLKKWDGFMEKGKRYGLILSSRDFFYTYNGITYFKPALEEVVYKIESPRKKSIVWKFETGKKGLKVSADETELRNRAKSIFLTQVKETSNYFFVLYGLERKMYLGMYVKASKQFNNVIFKDDLAGGFDFRHAGKCGDNQLMSVLMAPHAIDMERYDKALLPNRKKELDTLMSNLTEDDNPIVINVKLK